MDEMPSWTARNPAFSPPGRRDLHGNDAFLRWLHGALPLSVQHQLRDSGVLRFLADASVLATAPFVLGWHPSTIPRVLQLHALRRTFAYGHHAHQSVDYYAGDAQGSGREVDAPAVAFVHGGAWGSGRPWMYQLMVDTLLALGYSAVFMSKSTSPSFLKLVFYKLVSILRWSILTRSYCHLFFSPNTPRVLCSFFMLLFRLVLVFGAQSGTARGRRLRWLARWRTWKPRSACSTRVGASGTVTDRQVGAAAAAAPPRARNRWC